MFASGQLYCNGIFDLKEMKSEDLVEAACEAKATLQAALEEAIGNGGHDMHVLAVRQVVEESQ